MLKKYKYSIALTDRVSHETQSYRFANTLTEARRIGFKWVYAGSKREADIHDERDFHLIGEITKSPVPGKCVWYPEHMPYTYDLNRNGTLGTKKKIWDSWD